MNSFSEEIHTDFYEVILKVENISKTLSTAISKIENTVGNNLILLLMILTSALRNKRDKAK